MRTLESISTILKKNKSGFHETYKVREIGVFGSYARRRQKADSDVDILVEFDEAPDLFLFRIARIVSSVRMVSHHPPVALSSMPIA